MAERAHDRRGQKYNRPDFKQARRPVKGPISVEFPDYKGEKLRELPDDVVQYLTNPDEKALDDSTFECDVGIICYRNPELEGFDAILKHRYSDFIVNEIDLEGNIVKLTTLEVPKETTRWVEQAEDESSAEPVTYPNHSSLDEDVKPLFTPLNWTRLVQLAKKYAGGVKTSENESVRVEVTDMTKENRTLVHNTVKKIFPHLMSQTDTKPNPDGKKYIAVSFRQGENDRERNYENAWPRNRGKHLHFILHKIDGDSAAIFSQVSRMMSFKSDKWCSRFKIAGLKDRRGRTSQQVSISYVTAEKVKHIFCKIKPAKAFVGNFSYKKEGLELGDLGGNHFTIALRNIQPGSKDVIDKALSGLMERGFINYFGLQRFGTVASIKTSDIGLALIKSQWDLAIELILKPRPNEDSTVSRARAFWWMYRDAKAALQFFDDSLHFAALERILLTGLSEKHEKDMVGALGYLPKNSRLLYLHAYQSLVWNQAVTKRLQLHGEKVIIGDLVLLPDPKAKINFDVIDKFPQTTEEDLGNEKDSVVAKKHEQLEARIVEVTEENISEFTIFDVIMPVPGWRARIPTNESLKSIYEEILSRDGLTDGFASLKHDIDFYSLPGTYRKIVLKPWNFSWRYVTYLDPNADLILSDLDKLRNWKLPVVEEVPESRPKFEGLIVEMSLSSSTYATMALREAMKRDTSKSVHRQLTNSHNENFAAENGAKRSNENESSEVAAAKKAKLEDQANDGIEPADPEGGTEPDDPTEKDVAIE